MARLAGMIKKSRNKPVANLIKALVALALFYLVLRNIDFHAVVRTVREARWPLLVLQCVLYPVNLLIASLRLKYVLAGYDMSIKLRAAFDLNWIGGFFNNFLPSSIGGDLYRIVFLNRLYPQQPAQVVAAVVLDRGLGLLAMLLMAGLIGLHFVGGVIPTTSSVFVIYSAGVVLLLVSLFLLFAEHQLRLTYTSKYKVANKTINGLNVLLAYPNKKTLLISLVTSVLLIGWNVCGYYLLFLAFNAHVSFLLLLFIIPLVGLAGLIPISINAIGLTEGAAILLFSQFGFAPELILAAFVAARVLLLLCSATGGIAFLLAREVLPATPR